jgi:carbon starvation protein
MNILELFLLAVVLFILAYHFYARFLARRMGEEPGRPTPAVDQNDGKDFVPTSVPVLFAHHYATIAGAGPIIGPTMGILYGVGPAWLWIVIGGIFFGAVHDFSALFASIREGGRSIAEIARKALGDFGFLLFIAFTGIMLILVTSAFLSLTAVSLTSIWPIDKLGLDAGQTLLKTRLVDGRPMGVIGGIASTSVIIITACSPLLGFLIFKRRINTYIAFALAITVCIVSVYIGFHWPVSISSLTWMIIISVYVFIAAGLPVWIILQPRDFINVQILYFGLLAMGISVVIAGLGGAAAVNIPTFNLAEGNAQMGPVWPILFIIIACGAISGFHSLVAGGTTAKQLAREAQAKTVGYGAMILESVLAVLVILAIASSLKYADYMAITWPSGGSGNPILAYALAVGHLAHRALGIPVAFGSIIGILMVEGFVVTTLDSAVRLNRYIFEELWKRTFKTVPALFNKFWFNSGLAVVLMLALAVSNGYKLIWPVFGASNQLLAALSLLAVSAWLNLRGRTNWFTLIPAIIMLVTTMAALVYYLLVKYIPTGNIVLTVTDLVLLVLAFGVVIQTWRKLLFSRKQRKTAPIPT